MKKILLILAAAWVPASWAACPDLYPNGKQIPVDNTVELCNSWYVSRYDQTTNAVILVSEKLKSVREDSEREARFKTDRRVKKPITTSLYDKTGYDRGHMAPAEDSPDKLGMSESFLMTNVVPQDLKLNRIKWRMLESSIRKRVNTDIHIITGAIYSNNPKLLSKRVPIPSHMYKVVYFPWGVERFIAENKSSGNVSKITEIELERMTGIKFPK